MSEQRGNLYLLTGLAFGLALGLLISLGLSPVRYRDIAPGALMDPAKDEYRRMIAAAYAADSNLARARERLILLDGSESAYLLASQAQRMLAENGSPQEARALAILAADLANPPAVQAATSTAVPRTATPEEVSAAQPSDTSQPTNVGTLAGVQTPTAPPPTLTPTITMTVAPTFTPLPTATPLPVRGAPFVLQASEEVCEGTIAPGLLQVQVHNADGAPLPGVPVTITWQGGEETFYTGLVPEKNLGYADFVMTPGEVYTLKVGAVSEAVEGFAVPECGGGWMMEFSLTGS